ncbi:DUF3267 domain-containing protein [Haloterrigena alkaliphila]|uniref:DUF3267 domain-containing protein n=1 Tax=Haloterrigena alkaliphila TaxID=2816475 RepID=A0A8A2V8H6_9EURY|nr:DUF3267 domain-containing protein [Haloterrigena alkaliphila]QSW98279.1 DUF3267 domain-containing protein [Haloterrigena alkaliphila]
MSREPATDRLIAQFRRTRTVAIQWVVGSAIGFFAAAYAFGHVLAVIRGTSLEPIVIPAFSPPDVGVWLVASLGLAALVVVPHELLHGAAMARYGDDPEYGVGVSHFVLPYAYAKSEREEYTRNQMLVVTLAPFLGLTAVGLVAMVVYPSPLVVVALAANAAGSIGDLWMAAVLLQYPSDVRVAGLPRGAGQGFGVYGSSEDDAGRRPGMQLLAPAVSGAVGTIAILSTAFAAAVFRSLAVGSGTVVVGDPAGRWLLFSHERHAAGAVHLEIGGLALLTVAVAGGLAWALVVAGYRALAES